MAKTNKEQCTHNPSLKEILDKLLRNVDTRVTKQEVVDIYKGEALLVSIYLRSKVATFIYPWTQISTGHGVLQPLVDYLSEENYATNLVGRVTNKGGPRGG